MMCLISDCICLNTILVNFKWAICFFTTKNTKKVPVIQKRANNCSQSRFEKGRSSLNVVWIPSRLNDGGID